MRTIKFKRTQALAVDSSVEFETEVIVDDDATEEQMHEAGRTTNATLEAFIEGVAADARERQ